MALIPMDCSGEQKPLQPGVYAARIIEAKNETSKNGHPNVNFTFELFGSPEVSGRRVWQRYFTTMFTERIAALHEAATGEKIDKTAKHYDPEMLVGREVTATLVTRHYTGNDGQAKTSLEIKAVAPLKQ